MSFCRLLKAVCNEVSENRLAVKLTPYGGFIAAHSAMLFNWAKSLVHRATF